MSKREWWRGKREQGMSKREWVRGKMEQGRGKKEWERGKRELERGKRNKKVVIGCPENLELKITSIETGHCCCLPSALYPPD